MDCLLCQHSFRGIETEQVRQTLCQYCVEGSNFEPISSDQFGELLDLTECQRELIESEFEQFIER